MYFLVSTKRALMKRCDNNFVLQKKFWILKYIVQKTLNTEKKIGISHPLILLYKKILAQPMVHIKSDERIEFQSPTFKENLFIRFGIFHPFQ